MLKCDLAIFDLAFVCHASYLPAEFSALSEASSSKGMTLRNETSTRIYNAFPSIREIISVNGFPSLSNGAKS